MASLKLEIEQGVKDLAEKMREYSRSQAGLWQQVPWLALEAQGRAAASPLYREAYLNGYWGIGTEIPFVIRKEPYFVDLEDGELVYRSSHGTKYQRLLTDQELLAFSPNLGRLNVEKIVACLKEEAKLEDRSGELVSSMEMEEEFKLGIFNWREKLKQQLNLTEKYQRRSRKI